MAEMTTGTAAACTAATGGFTMACLAPWGINPPDMIAGLLGVIVVQTLLRPRETRDLLTVLGAAAGGVMLASICAPLGAPYVIEVGGAWLTKVPPESLRAALAAAIGGFAQRIVVWVRDRFFSQATKANRVKKETHDADA